LWKYRDVHATLVNAASLAGLEKRECNYADANCPGDEDKKRPSQVSGGVLLITLIDNS
jgi:hypothetical protein